MMTGKMEQVWRGWVTAVRRGFTLLELTVAAAMLAMLMASSVQMVRLMSTHQRAAERRVIALEAVQSVSDQIGNMPWDQLTNERAKQVAVPKPLEPYLPGAKLSLAVDDETKPAAKRLHVELTWAGADGQPVAPIRLTTWVFAEQSGSP